MAAGVRIYYTPHWLSYDESQHYLIAKSPLFADFVREFRTRTHPPLSYLLMKPFLALGSSFYWAKMMSMITGVLAIGVGYITFRRATGSSLAAVAGTTIMCFSLALVEQATEVRGYSLLLLFIWLSLLQYYRTKDGQFEHPRQQLLMALILSLALAAEYSAVFHVLALYVVVLMPVAVAGWRQRQWKKLIVLSLPYGVPLILTAVFFSWQFSGGYPVEHPHTRLAMYEGSWSDFGSVTAFLFEQVIRFSNELLPNPWGISVLAVVLLSAVPLLPRYRKSIHNRGISTYCIVALVALMMASVLRLYPLGSSSRHTVFIIPGTLTAGLVIIVGILRFVVKSCGFRCVIGGVLLVVILVGVERGISPMIRINENVLRDSSEYAPLSQYYRDPGPLVVNWRGRTMVMTWFLRSASSRMVETSDQALVFDAGGTTVVQSDLLSRQVNDGLQPPIVARWAAQLAKSEGRCWIVLSDFSEKMLIRERSEILRLLAIEPEIRVQFNELGRFARVDSQFRSSHRSEDPFNLFSLVMMIDRESGPPKPTTGHDETAEG